MIPSCIDNHGHCTRDTDGYGDCRLCAQWRRDQHAQFRNLMLENPSFRQGYDTAIALLKRYDFGTMFGDAIELLENGGIYTVGENREVL